MSKKGGKGKNKSSDTTVCRNKNARRVYDIEETYEAGLVLHGDEVKSLRLGKGNISDAFVRAKNGELFLWNFDIPYYPMSGNYRSDPNRSKKLLLHKREIERITTKIEQQGKTGVALAVYFNSAGLVKAQIGVGTGKKLHDRREDIKRKEAKREADRAIKDARG